MALTPGTRIGPYDVVGSLGAGAMGEVYRAWDTRLGRDVALKVLPASFADDAESRARFAREARTLAALNHPHIAQVYGLEESGATHALVLELVPGESLAARLARPSTVAQGVPRGVHGRGPMPLREALESARQIADGLAAAHEKGIVHRDLKPANVQVTPEGVVKILDFGLAKPLGPPTAGGTEDAATITSPAELTHRGVVLGTAAYMSPEQARGQAVDARTDVWAFGALLYELLTGTRPFPGPSITDTVAQILEREPDWTTLPAAAPATVRALVQRCMKKDLKQRLHDIADAKFALEDALTALTSSSGVGLDASGAGASTAAPSRAVWRHPLPIGLALVTLALGGALVWSWARTPAPVPREPQFLSLMLPPGQSADSPLAISPDGKAVVYGAVADEGPPGPMGDVQRLYYRRLNEPDARPLPGTESGASPGFSPDGEWVAFVSQADRSVMKIAVRGGGPVQLAAEATVGSTLGRGNVRWTGDGQLLVPDGAGPLLRVPASGGAPEALIPRSALEPNEGGFSYPFPLPRPGDLLFGLGTNAGGIAAWVGGRRQPLIRDGYNPQRLGDHLLFWRRTSPSQIDLSAVTFDASRVALGGDAVPVLSLAVGAGWSYAVSPTGTLVYRPAAVTGFLNPPGWYPLGDATAARPGFGPARPDTVGFAAPRVAPDGQRVLLSRSVIGRGVEIAVHEVATGTSRVVANGPGGMVWTVWSHDGRRVIYQAGPDAPGGAGLQWVPLDGSASAERLTTSKGWQQPQVVTRDGRFLVYQMSGAAGTRTDDRADSSDLWLLPLTPRGPPRPLVHTAANERLPHLSPGDQWMAYVSDESGRDEIWVRAFPDGEGAIRVSQEGGTGPLWAPDGRTLYYRDQSGSRLFAVPVTPGTPPQFGTATVTNTYWAPDSPFGRSYDVAPDGQTLLVRPGQTLGRELGIILNFDVLVQRKLAEVTAR